MRTCEIAGKVQREVEDEGLGSVKDAASAVFLRPLNGDILAAEESIIPENCHVGDADESGDAPKSLAHGGTSFGGEISPVERQHAHLREAHSDIVKVVGGEGDLHQKSAVWKA